jgi:hypothetical protein
MMKTHSPEKLAWLEARLRDVVTASQLEWADAEYEPERWFASLRLVSSDIDDKAVTFLFVDDAARSFGFRWPIRNEDDGWDALADTDEAVILFSAHLMEDIDTLEPSAPDPNGVRWLSEWRPEAEGAFGGE